MKKSELKNIISEEIRVALVSENTDMVVSVLRQIKDDDARSMLWDAYQNGHLSADKVVQIAKDTGGLRESSQDLFNNLRREIKEMVAIANAKNKYILGTEPLEVSVKPKDNFLFVRIKYPTGQGFLGMGGVETMSGQRRRVGAEASMQVGEKIKDYLKRSLSLEDWDVYDDERGTVTVFAVSDEFINMIGEGLKENEEKPKYKVGDKVTSKKHKIKDGVVRKVKETDRGYEYEIVWNDGNNVVQFSQSSLDEVYSEKQRRWACAQDDPKFDEMCKDTAISKKKVKETILKVLKNG